MSSSLSQYAAWSIIIYRAIAMSLFVCDHTDLFSTLGFRFAPPRYVTCCSADKT